MISLYKNIIIAFAMLVIGFAGGYAVNGWRLNSKLSALETKHAEETASAQKAALDDLKKASQAIADQAQVAAAEKKALTAKLSTITRKLKNAQARKKLPADCVLDPDRMRSLIDAVGAVNTANEADTGQRPGGAVPGPEPPGGG